VRMQSQGNPEARLEFPRPSLRHEGSFSGTPAVLKVLQQYS